MNAQAAFSKQGQKLSQLPEILRKQNNKNEDKARKILNEDNAADIYNSLKELKGSALKVAQMLSMEKISFRWSMLRNFHSHSFPFRHYRVLW